MACVISADDVAYEEDVLRQPFKVAPWTRYLSARAASPPAKRAAIYERALRALPGSYKLWHAYLTELVDAARARPFPATDYRAHAAAFERTLAAGMSRMPRVWHMYASALLEQRRLTRARRVLDRALRALPVTQHHRVWPLVLRLAHLPGCPAPTAARLLRRYLQFDPAYAPEFVAYLVSAGMFREAAEQLAALISGDDGNGFRGSAGNRQQLVLDLCDILTNHPDDVAGMPVEAILRSAVREFPQEYGVLWTALAGHYARKGIRNKARDVPEEAAAAATTTTPQTIFANGSKID